MHRDLNCGNIIINGVSDTLKIRDLGLATLWKGMTAPLSILGKVCNFVYIELGASDKGACNAHVYSLNGRELSPATDLCILIFTSGTCMLC